MRYRHLDDEEREQIAQMKFGGLSQAETARRLGRSAGTVSREIRRNRYPTDGSYKAPHAGSMYRGRRSRSRKGTGFLPLQLRRVEALFREDYSPEQVSGWLRSEGEFLISHETIYRHIWADRSAGGTLHQHLRSTRKQRRKGYGRYDSRSRLTGKAMIEERPKEADERSEIGHWEVDTVHGKGRSCITTIVDRRSGYVLIGKLNARTVEDTNRRLRQLISRHAGRFITITSDNGCEFHGYRDLEVRCQVKFYFAHPYHSWERWTNENTNGLIRQYLPKGTSMDDLPQAHCNPIADILNRRPRKRHGYQTPEEIFEKES